MLKRVTRATFFRSAPESMSKVNNFTSFHSGEAWSTSTSKGGGKGEGTYTAVKGQE